jgi:hypothetical protein
MAMLTRRDDYGDYNDTFNTTSTTISIAPLIVVGVIILVCWLSALGIIIYCCRRSKRLTAKWDQPGGFNYRGPAVVGTAANASQFGLQQQPQQPMAGMGGAAGFPNQGQVAPPQGYYSDEATKGIPQQTGQVFPVAADMSPMTTSSSPAPPYQGLQQFQTPRGYPAQPQTRMVSPMQNQVQPAGFSPQQNYSHPQQGQQGQQVYASPPVQQALPHQQHQTTSAVFELN